MEDGFVESHSSPLQERKRRKHPLLETNQQRVTGSWFLVFTHLSSMVLQKKGLVIDTIRIFIWCNLCLTFSANEIRGTFPKTKKTWDFDEEKEKNLKILLGKIHFLSHFQVKRRLESFERLVSI